MVNRRGPTSGGHPSPTFASRARPVISHATTLSSYWWTSTLLDIEHWPNSEAYTRVLAPRTMFQKRTGWLGARSRMISVMSQTLFYRDAVRWETYTGDLGLNHYRLWPAGVVPMVMTKWDCRLANFVDYWSLPFETWWSRCCRERQPRNL